MALKNFDEELVIMDKMTINTPTGPVATWREGANFLGSVAIKDNLEVFTAMSQGVKVTGYVQVDKKIGELLKYKTLIKWKSKNLYFIVANDGIQAPAISTIANAQFAIEVTRELPK